MTYKWEIHHFDLKLQLAAELKQMCLLLVDMFPFKS